MKKTKLIIDYDYNFELLGLISAAKEYKVAWGLNRKLKISLGKEPDLELAFSDQKKILISNYLYMAPHGEIRLFKNRAVEVINSDNYYLAPELAHYDFIFMVNDPVGSYDKTILKEQIRQIANIEYVAEIDVQQLKSKDNFLF